MKPGDIDYHCHILPNMDDGAQSQAEALEMARIAAAAGYKTVIATPHYEVYFCENTREIIRQAVSELREAVRLAGIPLHIEMGSEIMLDPEIPKLLAQKKLMTYQDQGTHVLIELPFQSYPLWTGEVLYQIQLLGITPVLAHPERYRWLEDNPTWLDSFKAKGMLLQVNVSSLKGKYGHTVQTRAERLWKENLADIWGSDAHSAQGYKILGQG